MVSQEKKTDEVLHCFPLGKIYLFMYSTYISGITKTHPTRFCIKVDVFTGDSDELFGLPMTDSEEFWVLT